MALAKFGLVITGILAFLLFRAAAAQTLAVPIGVDLGVDHCTWEPLSVATFYYRPDISDAASCEAFATQHGNVFTGIGSAGRESAIRLPSSGCTCDAKVEQWYFDASASPYSCARFGYSCSHPGTGCKWKRAGSSSTQVSTTEECRTKALECGAYYGFEGGTTANSAPTGDCVCGESRLHWYSDDDSSHSHLLCTNVRFKCLGPPKLIGPLPIQISPIPRR